MMDVDDWLIREPAFTILGIIEEIPEEVEPPACKIITVTKGGEKFQFCIPTEDK
jgi:hypothetical protein